MNGYDVTFHASAAGCRIGNLVLKVTDYSVQVVEDNFIMFSTTYGPRSIYDFDSAWLEAGKFIAHLLTHPKGTP